MVNIKRYKDRISKPKEQSKELKTWWKKSVKAFTPNESPLFQQRRGPRVLQSLAVSEYPDALVVTRMGVRKEDAKNYSQPDTGYIYLNFTDKDSERFKKIVAMHEASHLTLTPGREELQGEDLRFVEENKLLINLLEDIRCNRYLCLKYPGMVRYFSSELRVDNNPLISLCIGDLINEELDSVPDALGTFFDYKDEIRDCVTFEEVLAMARKLVQEMENPNQDCGQGNCGQGDGDPQDGNGDPQDGNGDPQDGGDSQSGPPQQRQGAPTQDGLTKEAKDFIEKQLQQDDTSSRVMNIHKDSEKADITSVVRGDKIQIFKKDKKMFLGREESFKVATLSKNAMKLLARDYEGIKKTREGRLGKINLAKLHSDGRLFTRKYYNRTPPKAYIVLDGSGSMYGDSTKWQKGLVTGLIRMFKQLNVDYQIFIHSGSSREFYYSEITDKDVSQTSSYCYTLDGSMLEALFENEIDPKERAIVFYFSDGQIPAQYPEIQVPLVEKYNMIAEKRGTPIFGIALDTTSVDYFTHWHIVHNKKDFAKTLEKIGLQMQKYM